MLGRVGQPRRFSLGQRAHAELQPPDHGAMHLKVCVAPDRAGEVGVARQGQAEMTNVLWVIGGLGLASQHHIVHQRCLLGAGHAAQDAVEVAGVDLVAGR